MGSEGVRRCREAGVAGTTPARPSSRWVLPPSDDLPDDATGVLQPVSQYSYPLEGIVEILGLMRVAGGHLDLTQRRVVSSEINRPGLQLTGYTEHFARIGCR